MKNLKKLETTFLHAIFDGPKNNKAIDELAAQIIAKQTLTTKQQIAIYRDSAMGGLVNALASLYPVCLQLIGEPFFNAMATQFIYQQTLPSPDIGDAGQHFPNFIKAFKPAQSIIYLADIAQLEWYWHKAFNATDSDALNLEAIAKLTEKQHEQLCFTLAPSAFLLQSPYPIQHIWQNNQNNEQSETIDIKNGKARLLIWRFGFDMRIDSLNEDQWSFLSTLQTPQRFSQNCEQLLKNQPHLDIPSLTAQAVQNGWIANFHLQP